MWKWSLKSLRTWGILTTPLYAIPSTSIRIWPGRSLCLHINVAAIVVRELLDVQRMLASLPLRRLSLSPLSKARHLRCLIRRLLFTSRLQPVITILNTQYRFWIHYTTPRSLFTAEYQPVQPPVDTDIDIAQVVAAAASVTVPPTTIATSLVAAGPITPLSGADIPMVDGDGSVSAHYSAANWLCDPCSNPAVINNTVPRRYCPSILLNARSLKNKLTELNSLLLDGYFVVSVTESWLNSSVTNTMIDTSHRHKICRNDRSTRMGGGVLCLVSNDWPSFSVPLPDKFRNLDVIAVTIMTDTGNIPYITVYRPPELNKLGRDYMVILWCLSLKAG